MEREDLASAATAEGVAEYVEKNAPGRSQPPHDHGAMHPAESVREATYRGHHILVRTTYHIEVDGVPIEGHVGVTNDGQVHYHAVPNMSFGSAIDLVKQLVDTFPDDFQPGAAEHTDMPGG